MTVKGKGSDRLDSPAGRPTGKSRSEEVVICDLFMSRTDPVSYFAKNGCFFQIPALNLRCHADVTLDKNVTFWSPSHN